MEKRIEIENWQTEEARQFHRKQYLEPKRSTVKFDDFLTRQGRLKEAEHIIDFGCGGGAADAYLASRHKGIKITGVDIVDKFFYMFEEFASDDVKSRVSLSKGDFINPDKSIKDNYYDGIVSLQTISFMENWEMAIQSMCSLSPEWIALSALFYEGNLDYQIKIKDFEESGITQGYTEKYYNIYPLPLVKSFLASKGYNQFAYEPFEIDIDIPKPEHMNVGTYTVRTEEGNRLQISGAMMMPWYFIYASKE